MGLTKRTQLYLSPEQWAMVEAEARRQRVSVAEVVRRSIEKYCRPGLDFAETVREVAGSWRDRPLDPRLVRKLREEWEKRPHGQVSD